MNGKMIELYQRILMLKDVTELLEDFQTVHGVTTIEEVYELINDETTRMKLSLSRYGGLFSELKGGADVANN